MIAPIEAANLTASVTTTIREEAESIGTTLERVTGERKSRRAAAVAVRHHIIQALFNRGFRICDIADAFDCDHSTIHYALNHKGRRQPLFGTPVPSLGPTPYRIRSPRVLEARAALAAALRAEGLSWPEVAAAAGYASHSAAMGAVERRLKRERQERPWAIGNEAAERAIQEAATT